MSVYSLGMENQQPTLLYRAISTTIQSFHDSRAFVRAIMGPLGSGKTFAMCLEVFTKVCEQEPNQRGIRRSRWVVIRNTYSDLENTTIRDWLEIFGEESFFGRFTWGKPPEHKLNFMLEDGTTVDAEIIFLALDHHDSVKKLRGMQLTGGWFSEMKELDKAIIDMTTLRVGRFPPKNDGGPSWYGCIGDTNAPDEDHWYYNLAENDRPEGWEFFRQQGGLLRIDGKWKLNPNAENLENLPDQYYVRGMAGKKEDWIRVNLANEYGFVMEGKPVHPEYQDSVHVLKDNYQPTSDRPIILGFDFGRTPACALLQQTAIGRYICFDEFYSDDQSAAQFAPELKLYIDRHFPDFIYEGWGDPAGSQRGQATDETPFMILRKHGIPALPTYTNQPLLRRAALNNNLTHLLMDGRPGFMLSPKCSRLRKALAGGFCYKRVQATGEARYKDEPDKNKWSHIVEALEYSLVGAGEGRAALNRKNSFSGEGQATAQLDFDPYK